MTATASKTTFTERYRPESAREGVALCEMLKHAGIKFTVTAEASKNSSGPVTTFAVTWQL